MSENVISKSVFFCLIKACLKENEMQIDYCRVNNSLEFNGCFSDLKFEKIIAQSDLIIKKCNELFSELPIDCDILLVNSGGNFMSGSISDLQCILDERDQHAFICPRTNISSIFSFPLNESQYGNKKRYLAWLDYAKKYLPKYSVVPIPEPHCVLFKKQHIQNLGGFNEECTDIRTAVQDLAMRWSKYGYSTIMANHIYFESTDREFLPLDDKFITNKHLEYRASLANYLNINQSPFDYFAKTLSGIATKKKIIFYLLQVKPMYNGTAEYSLALLDSFAKLFKDQYEISVLVPENTYKFFKRSFPECVNVFFEEDIAKAGQYDVVFSVVQYFSAKHLPIVFSLAPKQINVILDAIAWRCLYLGNMGETALINAFSSELSDGLLSISENSLKDVQAYLKESIDDNLLQSYTYLGSDFLLRGPEEEVDTTHNSEKKFEFLDKIYILIFGNSYKHKSTREAVLALRSLDVVKVVIGDNRFNYPIKNADRFIFIESGSISASIMEKIYANAHLLVFPSQYEGFGLPIFKAIQNCKKIFVYNNSLNRELVDAFVKNEGQVFLFNHFSDLSLIISEHLEKYELPAVDLPSWDDVAIQTNNFIKKVLAAPIDVKKILLKWDIVKLWPSSPGSRIVEQEISINMLWKMCKIYFLRKYTRYYHTGKEFLFKE